jgi:hypothetical protein
MVSIYACTYVVCGVYMYAYVYECVHMDVYVHMRQIRGTHLSLGHWGRS